MLMTQCIAGGHLKTTDGDGNTVLHHALVHGGLPEIAVILKAQAPIATANNAREQPLHTVARVHWSTPGIEAVLSRLLGPGVLIDGPDKDGVPPLCHFAAAGNKPAVDALLAGGAKPSVTDSNGCSALHYLAAQSCSFLHALQGKPPPAQTGRLAAGSNPADIQQTKATGSNTNTHWSMSQQQPADKARHGPSITPLPVDPKKSIFQQLKALIQVYSDIVDELVVRTSLLLYVPWGSFRTGSFQVCCRICSRSEFLCSKFAGHASERSSPVLSGHCMMA
jgi:hypothetical protein